MAGRAQRGAQAKGRGMMKPAAKPYDGSHLSPDVRAELASDGSARSERVRTVADKRGDRPPHWSDHVRSVKEARR